jgi:tRNA(Ile2) C34 agmatinyltransferase TiaS
MCCFGYAVDPSGGGLSRSATFVDVTEPAAETHEIVCPHCKKRFEGNLLSEGTRHEGFKCPHCRLFVPVERANGAAS